MKTKFLCLTIVCAVALSAQAQLEVTTSGNVKVKKKLAIRTSVNSRVCLNIEDTVPGNITAYYGVKSHICTSTSMPTSPVYALYGHANATASSYTLNYPIVGVYGYTSKNWGSTLFNAGIVGIAHHAGGIGVYGSTNETLPTTLTAGVKYAGYFTGDFYLNGTLRATNVTILSDSCRVGNIHSFANRQEINRIALLQPVTYTLKPDSSWIGDENAEELLERTHYGLIAQDVEKVFPELVYNRSDGLSVNYVELIPLLIQAIQELSAEVESLKAQIK